MKKYLSLVAGIALTLNAGAQSNFISSGKIEFERRTNSHRLYFSGEEGAWVDEFKKLVPQFRSDFFDLYFNETKSLYKPGRETEAPKMDFFTSPAQDNVVYKDLQSMTSTSSKSVFESKFLLTDSLKTADWKMESETRIIAGYECRKAITTICDSVVVVAFYTDQILPASGPESFAGLPGMIMGLAIPRLYTTWFATKVEMINETDEARILAPTKGKKASPKDMNASIMAGIKNWGDKFRDRSMWGVTL